MSGNIIQELLGSAMLGNSLVLTILFFGFLWWVLCIILFFKIWAMTNDINKMKGMMEEWLDIEHPLAEGADEEPKDNKVK